MHKQKKLIPTANILEWTNKYKEDTDIYLQFINENTEESETHIHTTILYEQFKKWFKITPFSMNFGTVKK